MLGLVGPSARDRFTPHGEARLETRTQHYVHTQAFGFANNVQKSEHQITKWQEKYLKTRWYRPILKFVFQIFWSNESQKSIIYKSYGDAHFCTFFNMLENAVCNEKTLCWGFSFKKIANFLDDQQQWGMRQMISTTTRHRNNAQAPRLFVKLCFLDDITVVVVVVTSMNDAASYIPTPNKGSYHLPLPCWWLLEIHRYLLESEVVTQIIFLFHICANIIFMDWVGWILLMEIC